MEKDSVACGADVAVGAEVVEAAVVSRAGVDVDAEAAKAVVVEDEPCVVPDAVVLTAAACVETVVIEDEPCVVPEVVVLTFAACEIPVIKGSYNALVANLGKRKVKTALSLAMATCGKPAGMKVQLPSTLTWSESSTVVPPPKFSDMSEPATAAGAARPCTEIWTST
mmetsp:Transcript_78150/g.253042  ORF Transcript_78150/g.253042 Transcript_78150/m.253042 type:complete len:167 (-) Transcript_78150:606-1106(-)